MKYKLTIETDNAEELIALIGGQTNDDGAGDAKVVVACGKPGNDDDSFDELEWTDFGKTVKTPTVEELAASIGGQTPTETAHPAPASTPSSDDTRDSDGLPWDERIHASSKAKNADGTWRKRRNVDDTVQAEVEAELKGAQTSKTEQPAAPVETTPMPTTPVEITPMPSGDAASESAQSTTLPEDFNGFMKMVQAGLRTTGSDGAPLITAQYLQELVGKINEAYASHDIKIASITDLIQHDFMIGWVSQVMQNDGRAVLN